MSMIGTPHLTTANDTTVAWSELGSGTPLVLLHGLAESHRTWRLVAPKLASRFRVLMLDLPGHGLSARPEAPYTVKWYADTVAAWMQAIGLERADVCGHSLGGGIAQWMLIEHRERINRLALSAAGGLGSEVSAALRLATLRFAAPFLESPLFGSGTRIFMRWASRSFALREAREVERLAELNAAPNSGLAFRRTVAGCIDIHGQQLLTWHHIHRASSLPPMALFWGERDSIIPVRHAHEAGRRLENVTVTVYPNCGHSLHLETPELFARDLASFLEERGRAPARLRTAMVIPEYHSRARPGPASVLPAAAA